MLAGVVAVVQLRVALSNAEDVPPLAPRLTLVPCGVALLAAGLCCAAVCDTDVDTHQQRQRQSADNRTFSHWIVSFLLASLLGS